MTDAEAVEAILHAADADTSNLSKRLRLQTRIQQGFAIFAAMYTALIIIFGLIFLVRFWSAAVVSQRLEQTAFGLSTAELVLSMYAVLIFVIPLFAYLLPVLRTYRLHVALVFARNRIIGGDMELFPVTASQPKPLNPGNEPQNYSHIIWMVNTRSVRMLMYMLGVTLLFFLILLIDLVISYGQAFTPPQPGVPLQGPNLFLNLPLVPLSLAIPLEIIGFVGLIFVPLGFLLFTLYRQYSGMDVLANDDNLTVYRTPLIRRRLYIEHMIAWQDIRCLLKFSVRTATDYRPQPFYLVVCDDLLLGWGYSPTTGKTLPNDANIELVRTILERTSLLLRDGNPLAREIARAIGGYTWNYWVRKLAPTQPLPPEAENELIPLRRALQSSSRERRITRWLIALSFAPGALYLIVAVTGMLLAGR